MFAFASVQTIAEKMQRYRQWSISFLILLGMYTEAAALLRPDDLVKEDAFLTCQKRNLTVYNTSSHPCCTCPIGQHLTHDCSFSHPETTRCEACLFDEANPDKQTFMDELNNATSCKPALNKTACNGIMNAHRVAGSTTTNARCECKTGFHPHIESIRYGCFPHSSCSPGFFAERSGTTSSDTVCQKCPPGTFNNASSPSTTCKKFSNCSGGYILQQGSSTHDVICNSTVWNLESTEAIKSTEANMRTVTQAITVASYEYTDVTPGLQVSSSFPVAWILVVVVLIFIVLGLLPANIRPCLRHIRRWRRRSQDGNGAYFRKSTQNGQAPRNGEDQRTPFLDDTSTAPPAPALPVPQPRVEPDLPKKATSKNGGCKAYGGDEEGTSKVDAAEKPAQIEEELVDFVYELPDKAVPTAAPSSSQAKLSDGKAGTLMEMMDEKPQSQLEDQASGDSATSPKGVYASLLQQRDYGRFQKYFRPLEWGKLIEWRMSSSILQGLLEQYQPGHKMMLSLDGQDTANLRKFLREYNYLSDGEINDIEEDCRGKGIAEIRHQWTNKVIQQKGRTLVAGQLLENLKSFNDSIKLYEAAFDALSKYAGDKGLITPS